MATTSPSPSLPPAVVVSPPAVVVSPKPGLSTSEGLLTLIVTLLTAAAGNPWVSSMPPVYKAISMALAVLAVLGYQVQRTNLKRAHLAAATGLPANAAQPIVASVVAKAASVGAVLCLAIGVAASCGGTSPSIGQIESTAGSAADVGLSCEGIDLEGLVGVGPDANLTLAEEFALDVASANYAAAVADFFQTFGKITGTCAALALKDFENGLAVGAGSASTAALSPAAAARAAILSRLDELEKTLGPWKRKAKAAKRASAAMIAPGKPRDIRPSIAAEASKP